ncbi:MAG: hypothetical protein KDB53_21620 [Planctomycetes bacterium]|nr:hypothetical protein [Planctomycetota bacterium]
MSLIRRIASIEHELVQLVDVDDAPVTLVEAMHRVRDHEARRRLGREGCRESAEAIRRLSIVIDEAMELESR